MTPDPLLADREAGTRPVRARRRTVVVAAGLTAGAAAVPTALRALPGGTAAAPAAPDRAAFTAHLGRRFTAAHAGGEAELELVDVLDLADDLVGDPRSFVARFRAAEGLAQDVYTLSRPGFAPTTMLLVPGRPDEPGTLSATFNRTSGGSR